PECWPLVGELLIHSLVNPLQPIELAPRHLPGAPVTLERVSAQSYAASRDRAPRCACCQRSNSVITTDAVSLHPHLAPDRELLDHSQCGGTCAAGTGQCTPDFRVREALGQVPSGDAVIQHRLL